MSPPDLNSENIKKKSFKEYVHILNTYKWNFHIDFN